MSQRKLENIEQVLLHDLSIKDRTVWIREDIDVESITKAQKNIQLILEADCTKPIRIFIQTYGGDTYSVLGLYDFIKSLPVPVTTVAYGPCFSAGTIIWCAGDQRLLSKNSVLMFHNISSEIDGKQPDISKEAEECEILYRIICKIYSENSNKSYDYWYKAIKHIDKYVRARDAIKMNLAHEIV